MSAPAAPAPDGDSGGRVARHLAARARDLLAPWLGGGAEAGTIRRNVRWLAAERAVRLVVGLVVNVWIVRALGAEGLGLLGFAQSLVGLLAVASQLGLESIVVRELVRRPEDAPAVLGSAAGLRVVGSTVTMALAFGAIALLRPGDVDARALVAVFAAATFFQSLDVIEYWFQSRSAFAPFVAARLAAFALAALAKVACLVLGASLPVLGAAIAAEYAFAAAALGVAYRRAGGLGERWRFGTRRAVSLLSDSWPLVLMSVAIVVYSRADQVLLATLAGDRENGIYAAAQRLSEILYFVPVAVSAAANPALLRSFATDLAAYEHRLGRLFTALAWTAIAIAVPVSVFAGPLVVTLFGSEFRSSAPVLAVHVWAAPAVFLGVAQSNWFIARGRTKGLLLRSAVAAATNVGLNLGLIPALGALGAALATLVSQVVASILVNAAFPSTRVLFRMQCRAFVPFGAR